MTTLPLFAKARNTDPPTSHEAARNVEASGSASFQRCKCLEAVRKFPGFTGAEISLIAKLERHAASRRLPELRGAGLVKNGEARVCTVMGTKGITWYPMEGE